MCILGLFAHVATSFHCPFMGGNISPVSLNTVWAQDIKMDFMEQKLINNSQALYKKAYQNDLRLANFLVEKFFFLLKGSKDEVFPVDQRKGIFGILRGKAKK